MLGIKSRLTTCKASTTPSITLASLIKQFYKFIDKLLGLPNSLRKNFFYFVYLCACGGMRHLVYVFFSPAFDQVQ